MISYLPLTQQSDSDLFTYNGQAIQAFKIEENGFNVFVYYNTQLYANKLTDAAERAEHKNEVMDRKVQRELSRHEKRKGKLTNEQLSELQPQDLAQLLESTPVMRHPDCPHTQNDALIEPINLLLML